MNCHEQLELMRAAGSVGDFERVTELAIDLLKWTRQQRANSSLRTVEEKASALLPANMVSHVSEELEFLANYFLGVADDFACRFEARDSRIDCLKEHMKKGMNLPDDFPESKALALIYCKSRPDWLTTRQGENGPEFYSLHYRVQVGKNCRDDFDTLAQAETNFDQAREDFAGELIELLKVHSWVALTTGEREEVKTEILKAEIATGESSEELGSTEEEEESDGEEITISLATGNDSFREHPATEIGRILRELADRFEQGNPPEKLFDHNGNCVGSVRIKRV